MSCRRCTHYPICRSEGLDGEVCCYYPQMADYIDRMDYYGRQVRRMLERAQNRLNRVGVHLTKVDQIVASTVVARAPTYHGKPCRRCGNTERRVSTKSCILCCQADDRARRERERKKKKLDCECAG